MDDQDTLNELEIGESSDDTLGEFSARTHLGGMYSLEVNARLPTEEDDFRLYLFKDHDRKEHLALVKGDVKDKEDVLCRVHSECLTGDLLGSLRCDCGPQLRESIRRISEEGEGILIYLRQEGRGIGLVSKLKAYNLQDQGYDTVEANILLGHKAEERDYGIASYILKELKVSSIRLLSNNPDKIRKMSDKGVIISDRLPMHPRINDENERYLRTKAERMDHIIDMDTLTPNAPEREEVIRFVKRSLDERNGQTFTIYMVQGLDGRIPLKGPAPYTVDLDEELLLRHQLRGLHDAYLIDVESLKQEGMDLIHSPVKSDTIPLVLDPVMSLAGDHKVNDAFLLVREDLSDEEKVYSERILEIPYENGNPDQADLMQRLKDMEIGSVMIEGSPGFITEMLKNKKADILVSTIVPYFFDDGACAMDGLSNNPTGGLFTLDDLRFKKVGDHMVYFGIPKWI